MLRLFHCEEKSTRDCPSNRPYNGMTTEFEKTSAKTDGLICLSDLAEFLNRAD